MLPKIVFFDADVARRYSSAVRFSPRCIDIPVQEAVGGEMPRHVEVLSEARRPEWMRMRRQVAAAFTERTAIIEFHHRTGILLAVCYSFITAHSSRPFYPCWRRQRIRRALRDGCLSPRQHAHIAHEQRCRQP